MDHSITVAPGSEFPVQAAGDFVFCKFADRDIRVIIQNSPRTMRAGSKWRPAGGFEAGDVIVQNPDPVNPVAVVLTIGVGDFDDQIIRGDVSVTPVLRTANGTTRGDSRRTISLDVTPQLDSSHGWVAGELMAENPDPGYDYLNDMVTAGAAYFGYQENRFTEFDPATLAVVARSPETRTVAGVPVDMGHPSILHPMTGDRDGMVYAVDRASSFGNGASRLIVLDPRTGLVYGQFDVGSSSRIPEGLLVDKSARQIVIKMQAQTGQDEFWVYSLDTGQFLFQDTSLDSSQGLVTAYEVETGRWYVWEGGGDLRTFTGGPGNWSVSEVRSSGAPSSGVSSVAVGRHAVVVGGQGAGYPKAARKYASEPFTTVSGLASIAGCGSLFNRLAKRRGLGGARYSMADVEMIEQDRRIRARGEVLRLVVEWYTGEQAPDDYLDHIYGARLFKTTGNAAEKALLTGAETFARAGVADFFDVWLPSRIELIVDNELATTPLF